MRVVLDTNVLIAEFLAHGECADLLEHCVLRHTLVTSDAISEELRRHLIDKLEYALAEADEVVGLLKSQMEVVTPVSLDGPVCRVIQTMIAFSARP